MTTRLKLIVDFKKDLLGKDDYIFGHDGERYSDKWVRKTWWEALKKADIPRAADGRGWSLHFHDLRGEFASSLHEAGVDVKTIQELLDHSSSSMTDRYIRVKVRKTSDAIERLETKRQLDTPAEKTTH